MSRGNHIVALDAVGQEAATDEFILTELADAPGTAEEAPDWAAEWDAEIARSVPAWRQHAAPLLGGAAIIGWTAAFVWSKLGEGSALPTLGQGLRWVADWSGPVLLVCVVWLLVMRTSTREAARFGDVARMLGDESDRLAVRLTTVNSELSMAREFIAAQARDVESLGRIAVERLSQHAESLQSLIHTNSTQLESIGSISSAALDNMEKLRGQLPVIATSARDVTNNIGNAGRTAHAQLQEMIAGFRRINDFGQASERQVESLRKLIGETLAELLAQSGEMETMTARRFAAIVERGEVFRMELDNHQDRAMSALQERSGALAAAVAQAHTELETQQEASLASFARRIDALSQGADAASTKLESQERAAVDRLTRQIDQLDSEIAAREARQLGHVRAVSTHGEALGGQLETLEARLAEISGLTNSVRERLEQAVSDITAHITDGRAALVGSDREIAELTEASVRLLELIQAGSQHSREHIPAALTDAENRLNVVEGRIRAMREMAGDVTVIGDRLRDTLADAQDSLVATTGSIEALHARLGERAGSHGESLEAIRQTLVRIAEQGSSVAAQIERELADAIDRAVEQRGDTIATQIGQAARNASELGRETTIQLRDQLAKVDELAGNLERRVSHARELAEERIENDFARRVALITESLNSNAIDIARVIDADVSDVAWEAYLKGDRGIFTRRVVSLIDAGEAKSIVQVYENDDGFRGHVNRYIHDFEAMLRQILSTRDGNALGVTLLSSDMGKLYVALAQAIERLRR